MKPAVLADFHRILQKKSKKEKEMANFLKNYVLDGYSSQQLIPIPD
jgi:hypothetical protein